LNCNRDLVLANGLHPLGQYELESKIGALKVFLELGKYQHYEE
jgi:hypothetical protein